MHERIDLSSDNCGGNSTFSCDGSAGNTLSSSSPTLSRPTSTSASSTNGMLPTRSTGGVSLEGGIIATGEQQSSFSNGAAVDTVAASNTMETERGAISAGTAEVEAGREALRKSRSNRGSHRRQKSRDSGVGEDGVNKLRKRRSGRRLDGSSGVEPPSEEQVERRRRSRGAGGDMARSHSSRDGKTGHSDRAPGKHTNTVYGSVMLLHERQDGVRHE